MDRILIVMVTSMGDIVHAQPVVADLRHAFPGVAIDWAVDADFADIVCLNRAISRMISAPLRQFKRAPTLHDFRAILGAIVQLREARYDVVLDLHGAYKSAIISRLARARWRYGYLTAELGEPGAAFAYNRRFAPREDIYVVERLRRTVANALGYTLSGLPEFDLLAPSIGTGPGRKPAALLFHGTSATVKKWPVACWREVVCMMTARGLTTFLPWSNETEKSEAHAIARGLKGAVILPRLTIEQIAQLIAHAKLVTGTDTGFVHLASAMGVPTVMVLTATRRRNFGIAVPDVSLSVGDSGQPPSTREVLEAIEIVMSAH